MLLNTTPRVSTTPRAVVKQSITTGEKSIISALIIFSSGSFGALMGANSCTSSTPSECSDSSTRMWIGAVIGVGAGLICSLGVWAYHYCHSRQQGYATQLPHDGGYRPLAPA